MTDEQRRRAIGLARTVALSDSPEATMVLDDIVAEMDRARGSEVAKESTIAALADALLPTAPENVDGPCWCRPGLKARGNEGDHGRTCQSRRAALRLAGHL